MAKKPTESVDKALLDVLAAINEADESRQSSLIGISNQKMIVLPVGTARILFMEAEKAKEIKQFRPLDISGSGMVEISIRHDGKVLWVNTAENACVLRICNIHKLVVEDNRPKKRRR